MELQILGLWESFAEKYARNRLLRTCADPASDPRSSDIPVDHKKAPFDGVCLPECSVISAGSQDVESDIELAIIGPSVYQCRDAKLQITYTSDRSDRRPVNFAFYVNLLADDELPYELSVKKMRASGRASHTENTRRAIMVFFSRSAKLYFENGESTEIALPGKVQHAWPLRVGVLIERKGGKSEKNSTASLYTLLHQLDHFRPVKVCSNSIVGSPSIDQTSPVEPQEQIRHLDIRFVSACKEELIIAFDEKSQLHSIWKYNMTRGTMSCDASDICQTKTIPTLHQPSKDALRPGMILRKLVDLPQPTASPVRTKCAHSAFVTRDLSDKLMCFLPLHKDTELRGAGEIDEMLVCGQSSRERIDDWVVHSSLSMPVLSAVPVFATRSKHRDVLFLHVNNTLTLWIGQKALLRCLLPEDIVPRVPSVAHLRPNKRRRSDGIAGAILENGENIPPSTSEDEPRSQIYTSNDSARLISLSQPAHNRVNLGLADGRTLRAQLAFIPKNSLTRSLLQALRCALPTSGYGQFYSSYLTRHYSPDLLKHPGDEKQEWNDWISTFQSLLNDANTVSSFAANAAVGDLALTFSSFLGPCMVMLHIVYEKFKLDQSQTEGFQLLGCFMIQLADAMRWPDYFDLYIRDGFLPSSDLHLQDLISGAYDCPILPFEFSRWLLRICQGFTCQDVTEYYSQVPKIGMLSPAELIADIGLHDTTRLIHAAFGESFTEDFLIDIASNSKPGYTSPSILPSGTRMLISQALEDRRAAPAGNWHTSSYNFVAREDLAQLFGKSTATFPSFEMQTTSQLSIPDSDGIELIVNELTNVRFVHDRRVDEVRRMIQSTNPRSLDVEITLDAEESDFHAEQQSHLQVLAQKVFGLPVARTAFTFGLATAQLTQAVVIPKLEVSARLPPMNAIVQLDIPKSNPPTVIWPYFHNGVATGASLVPDCPEITGTWIIFNAPTLAEDGRRILESKHAGFLLGLGLTGNLRKMNLYDLVDYMNLKDELTAIALLLGLAATHKGDQDMRHTRLCYSHVEPAEDISGKPTGTDVKPAALLSIGLLYAGSVARLHTEKMLYLLQAMDEDDTDIPEAKRESCSLACGLALGLIVLGNISSSQAAGIADVFLGERLLKFALGKTRPYIAASATVALGLIYLKTHDPMIAKRLAIPSSVFFLRKLRPDVLLLRVLAQNMILWDNIRPDSAWIESCVPKYIRSGGNGNFGPNDDADLFNQASWYIETGACLCIGLRFAGTHNAAAQETLLTVLKNYMALAGGQATNFSQKLNRTILRNCISVVVTALCVVASGSGDLSILRVLRQLHDRTASEVNYGHHMAVNMALGFLFLGGSTFGFGNSNLSVASLICALYPRYPLSVDDNEGHLQAFRHLWVLAIETRCLVTKDVRTKALCRVPVSITTTNKEIRQTLTPCLLPPIEQIEMIRTDNSRYWPIILEVATNKTHQDILRVGRELCLRRKLGHLSYKEVRSSQNINIRSYFAYHHTQIVEDETASSSALDALALLDSDADTVKEALSEAKGLLDFIIKDVPDPNDSDTDPVRLEFCTMVIDECIRLDRADAFQVYVWLDRVIRHLRDELNSATMWDLKHIFALYGPDSRFAITTPLVRADFIDYAAAEVEVFMRGLEDGTEVLGYLGAQEPLLLKDVLLSVDRSHTTLGTLPKEAIRLTNAYKVYREWPSNCEIRWIQQLLKVILRDTQPAEATSILESTVSHHLPHLLPRTVKKVVQHIYSLDGHIGS
ncbi:hypothetical protein DFS34DRAFT_609236 [Phlyctochytrium arcticum]|nr:hypothetical protein DFS34DRAFT_609236 [Phlyctochytrium arcticum]